MGRFPPSEREADHYAKTTGRNPEDINEQCRSRVAHIDGQLMQLLQTIHMRFQRSITFKVIKLSNPFTNVCGFCFNNIFCAATNFGCIDSFLLPNLKRRKMMGDGFLWCYCCRFVLNSKRLVEQHPVISRARRSSE